MSSNQLGNHNFLLIENDLYCFGDNNYCQLAFPIEKGKKFLTPTLFMKNVDVEKIVNGYSHTLMLMKDGTLMGFGNNSDGRLGLKTDNHRIHKPIMIMNDPNIRDIFCGGQHSLVLKNDGELYAFGWNMNGQCGTGEVSSQYEPALVMNEGKILDVACGYSHTMVLKENGDVMVFGINKNAQIGLPDRKDYKKPTLLLNNKDIESVYCGGDYSCYLTKDKEFFFMGTTRSSYSKAEPSLMIKDRNIKSVCTGRNHLFILMNNGELFGLGRNFYHQLGLPETGDVNQLRLIMKDETIRAVYAGYSHSMIYKANGDLLVFGSNNFGQLGIESDSDLVSSPTLLMSNPLIRLVMCGRKIWIDWSTAQHTHFPEPWKQRIFAFMLTLKYAQKVLCIKVPKPIIHLLIRMIDDFSFEWNKDLKRSTNLTRDNKQNCLLF